MRPILSALCAFVASLFHSRWAMQLKILALQHQLAVYKQTVARPRLRPTDRLFWVWLSRLWRGWHNALAFVQPRTVFAWQRQRLRQQGNPGRPAIAREARDRICALWQAQPTWGSPRMVGELRKLGIAVATSTVEQERPRPKKPLSPTLCNRSLRRFLGITRPAHGDQGGGDGPAQSVAASVRRAPHGEQPPRVSGSGEHAA